jgi:hypothetical protein
MAGGSPAPSGVVDVGVVGGDAIRADEPQAARDTATTVTSTPPTTGLGRWSRDRSGHRVPTSSTGAGHATLRRGGLVMIIRCFHTQEILRKATHPLSHGTRGT